MSGRAGQAARSLVLAAAWCAMAAASAGYLNTRGYRRVLCIIRIIICITYNTSVFSFST